MNRKNIYSIEEYFTNHSFIIPYYQRGYKWSLLKNRSGKTHLEQLLDDLTKAFSVKESSNTDYHLQGVTVQEKDGKSVLVDGQQRTTSLFLMLVYLNKCDLVKDKLTYNVREAVNTWITEKIENSGFSSPDVTIQDIAAFESAWATISKTLTELGDDEKEPFTRFLLERVKLIYVVLNTEPEKVFSMMNKEKAIMTQTDLVKAKLLSEASRQAFADFKTHEEGSHEWQINHLRGHFAREWDSWRKWWKEKGDFLKVVSFLQNKDEEKEPELARLLRLYWHIRKNTYQNLPEINQQKTPWPKEITKANLLDEYTRFIADLDEKTGNQAIEAVETFEELRNLQNILEEWYNDAQIYNWIGLMTHGSARPLDTKQIAELAKTYIDKGGENRIRIFEEHYRVNSLPNIERSDKQKMILLERCAWAVEQLKGDVYHDHYELVAQQLLRKNVQMLNKFNLKFDFKMYSPASNAEGRSLEHVHAQSNFFTEEERKQMSAASGEISSEDVKIDSFIGNSIGNMGLLPKGFNSKLSNHSFEIKKEYVFSALQDDKKRSVSLFLHTLSLFAKSKWDEISITKNTTAFIEDMERFYNCNDGAEA